MILAIVVALTCAPIAIDGDTIRCGHERIRLLGIDAPEMPGHCRPGRICVDGDPYASRANLARLLSARPLTIERKGTDRYGRTIALVNAGGRDLSCGQLAAGRAVYVRKWDDAGALASFCPATSR